MPGYLSMTGLNKVYESAREPVYALKDIDRVDVIVQSGVAAKPGLMLGAATVAVR